jgi:hypothetical protein
MVNEDGALVWLQSSGTFIAWSERAPKQVLASREDDEECEHDECETRCRVYLRRLAQLLTVKLPREATALQLSIAFA